MRYLIKIMTAGLALMTLLAGCKDYSDDIGKLNKRIDGLVDDLQTLKDKAGAGPVQAVTFEDGILTVTTQSGVVSYEIGTQTRVFKMELDGTQVIVNEEVVGSAPAGSKLDMLDDGTVTADGVAQSFMIATTDQLKKSVVFIYDAYGNVAAVKVRDDGVFVGLDVAALLAPSIASVVHIPSAIDGMLGTVEFFPVIVYDDYSTGTAGPVFAYNASGKTLYETFVPGWLTMNFRVNPANVDPAALGGYSFDHRTTYVSAQGRGAAPGLVVKPGAVIRDGSLSVQLQGLRMMKWSGNGQAMPGSEYDDPRGNPSVTPLGDDYYQADQLALQLVNRHANGQVNGGVVSSAYVYMKRLVVLQRDIAIGLTVAADATTPAASARPLADMYTDSGRAAAFTYSGGGVTPEPAAAPMAEPDHTQLVNAYKTDIPSMLNLPYSVYTGLNAFDLDAVVTGYFTQYHTNRGHDSSVGQYDFSTFGFDAPLRRYALEPYDDGASEQYYSVEKMAEYVSLTADGKLSFAAAAPYAAGLEPVVRVDLTTTGGTLLMTKLIKITIAPDPTP